MAANKQYPASDEFIVWAQSLSGMLTKIKTEYGCVVDMVEGRFWNEDKTGYALALIQSLSKNLSEMETALSRHVKEKFSKKDN